MIEVPLATAFTAGLVAAVNPCGFPMLPAYLSWFIGMDDEEVDASHRVGRALLSGSSVAFGFLLVFAGLGIPINAGFSGIYRAMPWFTVVMGAAFVMLGVAMLRGYRLEVVLPHLDRGAKSRRYRSMVLFGASYAIASLSCTLPIFLVYVAGTAHRSNWLSGFVAFLAYGAGITLVLLALSLAIALARDSMVRTMRSLVRFADRAAAVLLVIVGVYLVYYGIYALDSGNRSSTGVGTIDDWSSRASSWLEQGGVTLGWVLAAVVAAGLAWVLLRGRRAGP